MALSNWITGAYRQLAGGDVTPYFNAPDVSDNYAQAVGSKFPKQVYGSSTQGGTAAPTQSGTTTSGGTQLGASSTVEDPYARWGGQTAYSNLLQGYQGQEDAIYDTATSAANAGFTSRKSSIMDFILDLQRQQQGLDERGVQNELKKKQGYNSVTDMVGRGIRQGGTMLANRNASDSSATEAIAMAYGDQGRRQMGNINNQYGIENRNLGLAQEDLGQTRETGLRKFDEDKTIKVNQIVTSAQQSLADLNAEMLGASLPERIAIEQEIERLKGEVVGILSAYDQELNSGAQGVQASSPEARRQQAFQLANQGQAVEDPFNFTPEFPAQFQNTGPTASSLPIYTYPRYRREG